ncbi:discoidin domain-containing protein [Dickeya dianthicola]|uniref:discoidin domain-containing protein n=1 Tax=Dickeya dianthicola TaxID=204039 RepID=UPI001BDE0281|nr:discoidin domain-containing protein [Dickeya dianthicola]MBT1488406.1 discoidin domain-containing protein [Dickeya dianthicola]
MWYKAGSLSLFSGSKVVLGNNTAWADKSNSVIAGGMLLIFADCSIKIYEIASVVSDTELVLASEYIGCTENGVQYAVPVFGSDDKFDHAAYVAQVAAMLAGYQSQLTQWKQVLTEHGQVTLTDNNGQNVVVKTLPDLTDAVSRMMDKTLNGADIPDKAQFVANLGLSDVARKSDLTNHTHTASQITDFTDAVRKVLVTTLAAGQGVALNYDTSSSQLVVSATGGNSSGGNNGGGGYTVVTRMGTTANQVFSFPLSLNGPISLNGQINMNGQMDYNFDAYALKEESELTSQTVAIDTFSNTSVANYDQTNNVVFDGQLKPYTGETYSIGSDGSFYSSIIKADGASLSVSSYSMSTVVPVMTSASTPAGYVASASSAYNASYAAYYAFDGSVSMNGWISANAPTAAAPQWLEIELPSQTQITGYIITNPNLTIGGLASPKSWLLQGSNDGSVWTTIHSVSNNTNNTADIDQEFPLSVAANYSKYRLYITDRNSSYSFVSVKKLKLVVGDKCLISDSFGNFYTASSGVLTKVNSPSSALEFSTFGFVYSGVISRSTLSDKLPIKVWLASNPTNNYVRTSYGPPPQIIIPKSLTSVRSWQMINSAQLSATLSGKGAVSVAVSRDLNNWVVWNGSSWVSIGSLSADGNGANKLVSDGMSVSSLNQITTAQWALLFPNTNGVPDALAFALALNVPDPSGDNAAVDTLVLNVNNVSAWKKQTEAEVEIRWYPDKVSFKTVAAGNYKLAYQQP